MNPVVCGEVEVDRLTGDVVAHGVFHFKNGALLLDNVQIRGEVESQLTHEIFEVKDSFKGSFITQNVEGHSNLNGDKGSRYILSYTYNGSLDTYTFIKAVCK